MSHGKAAAAAAEIIKKGMEDASASAESESWNRLALALKLSELCDRWKEFAGGPLSAKSQPASCEYIEDYIKITINVSESSVLAAARFRKAGIERKLKQFLKTEKLKTEMKIGPVIPASSVSAPVPPYLRRAPILLAEEDIEKEKKEFEEAGVSDTLACGMARVKLSAEKLAKRKKRE